MTSLGGEPDPQPDFGDVKLIGGKPYRLGFLRASWGSFDPNDPARLRDAKRENVLSFPGDVYHYTSIAAFKGIMDENGFWASDNRFMNDTEENWNGIELALRVLEHRAKRTTQPAFAGILRSVSAAVSAPENHGHLVTCFSTVRDDLGQWRGYGSGGVCLRIGNKEVGESSLFFGPEHLLHQAIYEDRRKSIILLSKLRRFEREYVLDRIAMNDFWPGDYDENFYQELRSNITAAILSFKNNSFRDEREVRLVLSYRDINKYEGGLQFRASGLGIIPYLRTGDNRAILKDGGRLPLREVIIGPAPHQELIAQSIEMFLAQKSYTNTKVTLSRIPYRPT